MKKTKMLIAYVALLAAMPVFIYLSGCASLIIPSLICAVACEDDCNNLARNLWCPPGELCSEICEVDIIIPNPPQNCRISSGFYLTTDDGSVYMDDRDPINGNLIPKNHTNGNRTVQLKKCYAIDPLGDPQAQLDDFEDSLNDGKFLVQICQTNTCLDPPIPGADQTLLMPLPGLALPWTFTPDVDNCKIIMTFDTSQLTPVSTCTFCCN